jgi:hypothetical protein
MEVIVMCFFDRKVKSSFILYILKKWLKSYFECSK